MAQQTDSDRWRSRPGLGATVKAAVVVLPIIAGVVSAIAINAMLPHPTTARAAIAWWVILVGGVTASSILVSRLSRRLLPLAALLKLTLTFPDEVPSRLRVARAAGRTQDLKKRVEVARSEGWPKESVEAAGLLLSLIGALALHDRGTRGHSERVRVLVDLLGEELDLPSADRERLRWAALIHDIGKLEVETEILNKPDAPDEHEWSVLHRHPVAGMEIAAPLLPWLGPWGNAIRDHHEKYDGSGYPNGLVATDISLGGRIVAVADSFETMTARRPYKKPMTPQAARTELVRCSGTHFDPVVVRQLLNASVHKLWWIVGIGTAVAQIPLVGALTHRDIPRRIGLQVAGVGGAAVTVGAIVSAGLLNLASLSTPDSSPQIKPVEIAQASSPPIVPEFAPVARQFTASRPEVTTADEAPDDSPAAHSSDESPRQEDAGGDRRPLDRDEGAPVHYHATGRVKVFSPTYPDQMSVTQVEFLARCEEPGSQGWDGWVFDLPEALRSSQQHFAVRGTSSTAAHDLHVHLYSESCVLLAQYGGASVAEGTTMPGTSYIFVGLSRGVETELQLVF